LSARDWRAVREGDTHAAARRSPKSNTPESLIVGVGASGALLAGAAIVFITLLGLVSFNVWPAARGGSAVGNVELQAPSSGASHGAGAPVGAASGQLASTGPSFPAPPTGDARGGGGGGRGGGDARASGGKRGGGGGGGDARASSGTGGGTAQPPPTTTTAVTPPSSDDTVGSGNGNKGNGNGNGGGNGGGNGSSNGGDSKTSPSNAGKDTGADKPRPSHAVKGGSDVGKAKGGSRSGSGKSNGGGGKGKG
jgi:hypothetical protein